jgi:hypothetical protein
MPTVPRTTPSRHRLYRFGWLAMKFEGRPGREVTEFFQEHFGVTVSEDTVDRAFKGARARNERKKPRGPKGEEGEDAPVQAASDPDGVAVWTDWLKVDEHRLGVRKVLIRVPNDGFEIGGLVDALERMPGIRQVIETKELREVFAVALLRSEEEEEDLRSRILEHAEGRAVSVSVIRRESSAPTAVTWLGLAKDEARELE